MVPAADLVTIIETVRDKHIDRKKQQVVVYVRGYVAGDIERPVYAMIDVPKGYVCSQLYTDQPVVGDSFSLK